MTDSPLSGLTGLKRLRARFGPGLLFAAAAVGTSHVVQSTRAGAGFGLTLGILILLVCILKYPLFRFAADYAAATGENLVRGYGRQGRLLVIIMFVCSAIEAVAAVAGVSLVSASIGQWLLGTRLGDVTAAVGLLLITAVVVGFGRYKVLESITGILVIVFSVLTLITTLTTLPSLIENGPALLAPFPLTSGNWSFAIAVSGWMPIGNTAAVMLAAWILAKQQESGRSVQASRFDFNLGYIVSVILAFCFLLIGAAVLFGSSAEMPQASAAFVTSFVGLYTSAIGSWSALVVSIAALAVMYSTMIAIVDGFPRMMGEFVTELRAKGDPVDAEKQAERLYLPALMLVVAAASLLLFFFLQAFATFIDFVTFIGFLAAPVVAWANQRVILSTNVPQEFRPGPGLIRWNQVAVTLLTLATLGYLYLRWG